MSIDQIAPTDSRRREVRDLMPAVVIVVGLHLVGWGVLLLAVVPQGFVMGSQASGATVFGAALGIAAYLLGMRHAFDADHIAAIDNTTRRMVELGRPSSSVGLWFSLGHSSVVLLMCIVLAFGVHAAGELLLDEDSALQTFTGFWGPTFSGVFLLLLGVLNLIALRRRRRRDVYSVHSVGGPVTRVLERVGAKIDNPRRMYLVGMLFGFGFDTATEVGLLILAGTSSISGVPWYAILVLPVLFAAGMTLLDTAQGAAIGRAYRATANTGALRNHAVLLTLVGIVVAFVVGIVQLVDVVLAAVGEPAWGIDVSYLGIGLTAALLLIWGLASLHARAARRR
ncbi:HoxN/HupN/NixA family nickel/cobalt transporter [Microbacterium sp. NPDC087589]|uniref:HoxN/HupN/NixA family nickel/cobalt transporter n=1 Tax=Microbacterium sp. NPDC087589 TaxID=3364191 RepID=UPI00380EE5BA